MAPGRPSPPRSLCGRLKSRDGRHADAAASLPRGRPDRISARGGRGARRKQPSVSAAIAALSRELGARAHRALRLERPAERRRRGVHALRRTRRRTACPGEEAVREVRAGEARELRIAAVTTAAEHLLPALLGGFTREHPGARLAMDVANRERVFRRLGTHEADVAMRGARPAHAALVSAPFSKNAVVVIAPPGDALAAAASVDLAELADRT